MFPQEYDGKELDIMNDPGEVQSFARKFKNWAKKIADQNGWELIAFNLNWTSITGFFRQDNRFIYFSYEIKRFVPIDLSDSSYANGIMFRTAKSEKDYTGGINHFSSIKDFPNRVFKELET